MGTIGYSYGSEWHLLRFLGYHRDDFNRHVQGAVPGGRVLDWLPARYETEGARINRPPFTPVFDVKKGEYVRRPRILDAEWKGIRFLPDDEHRRVLKAWKDYWPQRGNQPNWDAIGRVDIDGESHWLLVEAKSHIKETISECGASDRGGRGKIREAFRSTAAHMGVEPDVDRWMSPYYQHANRLAVLSFLIREGIKARLIFVYFLGDRFPEGRAETCPATAEGWAPRLDAMERHIGWTEAGQNGLFPHVHKAFIPVCPMTT